jgi:hypothetical protein
MIFVFPLQAVSSVYGFVARDIIAGTGIGLLSGAWLVIGMLTYLGRPGRPSAPSGSSCSAWPSPCWSRLWSGPPANRWPAW